MRVFIQGFELHKVQNSKTYYARKLYLGFSLVEIVVAIAIVAILAMFGVSSYEKYFERVQINEAIQDITLISAQITDFQLTNGRFPISLEEMNINKVDPWGNPYRYLPLVGSGGGNGKGNDKKGDKINIGKSRKNRNLVPINSDFDLYSMGEDGKSVSPLTAKASQDDIVRGGNGKFVGLASDY